MTAPVTQFTLGAVDVSGYASRDLSIAYAPIGGYTIIRDSDGNGTRQQAWTKTRITITGQGRAPTALRALTFSAALGLTVPDPEEVGGTQSYTVFAELTETHNINGATTSWTLVCEEE